MKDLLIVLFILIFIIYNIYFNETFYIDSLPYIYFNDGKNILISNEYISNKNIEELKQIPELKYISRKDCPIMYKLFKDIESDDNMERIEALRLRNKIQSVFFNTDEIIRAEYQIINISKLELDKKTQEEQDGDGEGDDDIEQEDGETDLMEEQKYENKNFNIPNFEFNYLLESDDAKLKYIEDTDKHLKLSQKETFGVEGNFNSRDIMNFMEYCFTILTSKMVPIQKLVLNNAAMYAMKCPICSKDENKDNSSYNIVPVRIVQQCLKEEKEFTRAKCTRCCTNILVYFKSPPNKYLEYYKLDYSGDNLSKMENIKIIKN